jgi:hypothetical protein
MNENESPHNPGEPEFGDEHGGEHNPVEPSLGNESSGGGDVSGEGDRPDHPSEGTSPPGNPETDEDAVREGEDRLDQAGGGQ